jgi:hypothetical protein
MHIETVLCVCSTAACRPAYAYACIASCIEDAPYTRDTFRACELICTSNVRCRLHYSGALNFAVGRISTHRLQTGPLYMLPLTVRNMLMVCVHNNSVSIMKASKLKQLTGQV